MSITTANLRRHVSMIAGEILAARQALDASLAGNQRYDAALTNLGEGIHQLQALATDLSRGAATIRPGAPLDRGDLGDGQLVTRTE